MIGFPLVIGLLLLLHGTPVTGSPICSVSGAPVAAISLVTGANPQATPDYKPRMFEDIPRENWTYPATALLLKHKILLGYPDSYFSGKRILTRYEFAVAVKRSIDAIVPQPPSTDIALETPHKPVVPLDPAYLLSEDLKLLRKLSLEFKPELLALGMDWKAKDDYLLKLQDKKLHDQVAAALAAVTKSVDNTITFQVVKRPNWAYDSFERLERKLKVVIIADDAKPGRLFTHYEFAVATKRLLDAFPGAEIDRSDSYDLDDVVELHKLTRTFCFELAQLGSDIKEVEHRLTQAEEKRIRAEETIDIQPPVAK